MKNENIYITWHLPTHGIGYTKSILAAYFAGKCRVGQEIDIRLNQIEMEEVFDGGADGFLFDKIYYLHTSQEVVNKVTTARASAKMNALSRDTWVKKSGTSEIWKAMFEYKYLSDELDYLEANHLDKVSIVKSQYWRFINDYTIHEQLKWFRKMSNFSRYAEGRFETVDMTTKGVHDLRDYMQIAKSVQKFVADLRKRHPEAIFVFNISLGSYETQVVWFCLAEAGLLPQNTHFIATYDDKSNTPKYARFRDFDIKSKPTKVIANIRNELTIYQNPKSVSRKLAELKMKNYINAGFAILLVGERGTGKSRLVKEHAQSTNFISADCASFDDDSKAESELFGTTKGSYTDAQDKDGLFQKAAGGVLFLDEIHNLSKFVQAKLMRTLGTDKDNNFTVRKMGDTKEQKVKCTFIAATNLSVDELKKRLLPDFYDRISQLIIEIPPLRDTLEDRIDDWKKVCNEMQFNEPVPLEPALTSWLKQLDLHGNFRDLQKIAIYYHRYTTFSTELKQYIPQKNAVNYAKAEFKKYHLVNDAVNYQFSLEKSPDDMLRDFKSELATWLMQNFGTIEEIRQHVKHLGDSISKKTLYNWKNKT